MGRVIRGHTLLDCSATSGEKAIAFVINSSGYPFEIQTKSGARELRPVDLRVTSEMLGYALALPSHGGLEIRFPEGAGEASKTAGINQLRLFEEILGLTEDPKTEFTPQPYSIVQIL